MSIFNKNSMLLMMLARREGLEGQDAMRTAVMASLAGASGTLGLIAGKQLVDRQKELQDLQEPVKLRVPHGQRVEVLGPDGNPLELRGAAGWVGRNVRLGAAGNSETVDFTVGGRTRRLIVVGV